ncbi:tRNA epoxyqueuosine(34) reductase QueG [bacterium]|nr:tRNA epoxyqueuosine(34) reductase QueG [bacterium]
MNFTEQIKSKALKIGFHKVGIAPAEKIDTVPLLEEWLSRGYHGTMSWMERNRDKREDPRVILPGAHSIICVALNYYTSTPIPDDLSVGKISRYAWGDDYHEVVKNKLHRLLDAIQEMDPSIEGKCCVDTAPVMDKYWAAKAGIGWQGKHSNVITREMGSWVFLGEIIVNKSLEYDEPAVDFCGTCRRCIDACPTQAITEPYVVNSARCISYLTIEHHGEVLPDLPMQNWIYGCDICQDVCPWNNKFSKPTDVEPFNPRMENINLPLDELVSMNPESFQKRFKKSAVKRTKFSGFNRNIRHVMNQANKTVSNE